MSELMTAQNDKNTVSNLSNNRVPEMRRVKTIHFVGIGGAGMGGIAEVLLNEGYQITGSDIGENQVVKRLMALGAKVTIGHHADNVSGASVIVVSTAIDSENPGDAGFTGSLVIAEFDSLIDAQQWADIDPYVAAGVYKNVTVKPYKKVLPA